ncbi:MAG: fasciclin domain-containing protein [Bacteroidia bacterium]|nr:fasciclin domain-containing protein [Bacteroidia bacterium]
MKTFNHLFLSAILTGAIALTSCKSAQKENSEEQNTNNNNTEEATVAAGQSAVQDDESQKDVVKIAVGSKDHTTLVAAVKAGELVDILSNAGPFTVFAPTNAAFDKLPKGTVEELLKPEKKDDLQNILQYHVTVSTYQVENLRDGQTLGMVNGSNATITVKDGKASINGVNIVASVKASNGIVHVIDGVLLPPAGK